MAEDNSAVPEEDLMDDSEASEDGAASSEAGDIPVEVGGVDPEVLTRADFCFLQDQYGQGNIPTMEHLCSRDFPIEVCPNVVAPVPALDDDMDMGGEHPGQSADSPAAPLDAELDVDALMEEEVLDESSPLPGAEWAMDAAGVLRGESPQNDLSKGKLPDTMDGIITAGSMMACPMAGRLDGKASVVGWPLKRHRAVILPLSPPKDKGKLPRGMDGISGGPPLCMASLPTSRADKGKALLVDESSAGAKDCYKCSSDDDSMEELQAEVAVARQVLHQCSVILVFRGQVIPRHDEAREFFEALFPGDMASMLFYPHGKGMWHIVLASEEDAIALLAQQGLSLSRHAATLHAFMEDFSIHKDSELKGGMYLTDILLLDVPAKWRVPQALQLLIRPIGQHRNGKFRRWHRRAKSLTLLLNES